MIAAEADEEFVVAVAGSADDTFLSGRGLPHPHPHPHPHPETGRDPGRRKVFWPVRGLRSAVLPGSGMEDGPDERTGVVPNSSSLEVVR
ncbi:MAG: hypothetical protein QOE59_5305, partial [Actinomycetota bacterium]|nr:hypothetical protein [Actinomycetota bacterium]